MNDNVSTTANNFSAHMKNAKESSHLPANRSHDYYDLTGNESQSYRAGIKHLKQPILATTSHSSSALSSTPIDSTTSSSAPFPSAASSTSSTNSPHINDALHQSYFLNWVDGKPVGYPQQSRGAVQRDLPPSNQTSPHNRWHASVSSHSTTINTSHSIPTLDRAKSSGNGRAPTSHIHTAAQRWKAVSGSEPSSILHTNTSQTSNLTEGNSGARVNEKYSFPIEQQTSIAVPSKRTFKEMLLDELNGMNDSDGELRQYSKDAILSNQSPTESAPFSLQRTDDGDSLQSNRNGSFVVKLKMPPEGKLPKVN